MRFARNPRNRARPDARTEPYPWYGDRRAEDVSRFLGNSRGSQPTETPKPESGSRTRSTPRKRTYESVGRPGRKTTTLTPSAEREALDRGKGTLGSNAPGSVLVQRGVGRPSLSRDRCSAEGTGAVARRLEPRAILAKPCLRRAARVSLARHSSDGQREYSGRDSPTNRGHSPRSRRRARNRFEAWSDRGTCATPTSRCTTTSSGPPGTEHHASPRLSNDASMPRSSRAARLWGSSPSRSAGLMTTSTCWPERPRLSLRRTS